jgi:hypothetical protein
MIFCLGVVILEALEKYTIAGRELLEQDIYKHSVFIPLCCFIPGVLSHLGLFCDREDRKSEKSLESSSTVVCLVLVLSFSVHVVFMPSFCSALKWVVLSLL